MNKQTSFLLTVFLLVITIIDNKAQIPSNKILNVAQIDSIIKVRTQKCENKDTLCLETFSHGKSKFYKKILRFINVRYGTGETFKNKYIYNDSVFSSSRHDIRVKKKKNHHDIENFFFINDELVKYEKFAFWANKKGENDILDHQLVLYFNDNVIINKELKINDRFKFNEKYLDMIIENSDKIRKEINPIFGH